MYDANKDSEVTPQTGTEKLTVGYFFPAKQKIAFMKLPRLESGLMPVVLQLSRSSSGTGFTGEYQGSWITTLHQPNDDNNLLHRIIKEKYDDPLPLFRQIRRSFFTDVFFPSRILDEIALYGEKQHQTGKLTFSSPQ